MAVENVSFRGVEVTGSRKSKLSFKGVETPIDEEKSNATKYMIGATALAGIAALGIAGYKGHLGEGIQKFLGGAEKAAKKGGTNASESAGSSLSRGSEKLEDDLTLNRGLGSLEEDPYVTRGIYGQDINDPLDPMNAYDTLSPYYKSPLGTDSNYGIGENYGMGGGFGF